MASPGTRALHRSSRARLDWRQGAATEPDAPPGAVDVILPVYGAPDELGRCLDSLLRHTDLARHHLRIVEDAGSGPRVDEILRGLERRADLSVTVEHNSERLGFVGSVNRGMRASARDVVLLNSDTELTAGWLEKMQRAAYSAPGVATVTPFSNDATICSLPQPLEHNEIPAGHDLASFAELVERCSIREYPRLPTGVGMCLYVKRKVLERVGLFDERRFGLGYGEENDFCVRALLAGYVHVLDDATFVFHAGARSFGAGRKARSRAAHRRIRRAQPAYLPMVARFLAEDPLAPARERVLDALRPRRRTAAEVPFPRVLHLVHGWPPWSTAGTELYARWLAVAQADVRAVAAHARVADPERSEGEAIELFDHGVRVRLVVNNFTQRNPLVRNSLRNPRLERDFARLLAQFRPDLLHVHHLLGHGASLLGLAARAGVPVLYQAQDWWPACARVNLTHRDGRPCAGPGILRCAACFAMTRLPPERLWNPLLHVYRRRALRRALRVPAAFVMGSGFIARTYEELGLVPAATPVFVRSYGVPLAGERGAREPRPSPGTRVPLRFGVVGSLLPHKGAHVAVEAFRNADPERSTLEVWGDASASPAYRERLERLKGTGPVSFRGTFDERDKARVLASFDALVMPSIGRESFGLVAREAMAVGTPVIVARGSALEEAVGDGRWGGSFEPGNAADLARLVASLVREPATLARWSAALPAVKSFAEHAEEIEEVYRQVARGRAGGAEGAARRRP